MEITHNAPTRSKDPKRVAQGHILAASNKLKREIAARARASSDVEYDDSDSDETSSVPLSTVLGLVATTTSLGMLYLAWKQYKPRGETVTTKVVETPHLTREPFKPDMLA